MTDERIEPKIAFIDRISPVEVHMMGDYVAVQFKLEAVKDSIIGADGEEYTRKKLVRMKAKPGTYLYSGPHISFTWYREDGEGGYYIDEDSIADDGFTADTAIQLAQELILAAQYLEQERARDE